MTDVSQNQPTDSPDSVDAVRDLALLAAVEIVGLHAVDLMTATAVKLGLFEGGDETRDLAEARILIEVVAGFVDGAAREVGHHHAAPMRDGLKSLRMAFREYSHIQDAPGQGPGERYTGYVAPAKPKL